METKLILRIAVGIISLIAGIYFLLKGWFGSMRYIILAVALFAVFAGCAGLLGDILNLLEKPPKRNFRRRRRKRY